MSKSVTGFLLFILTLVFTCSVQAQTRVLVGGEGGEVYSNVFGSINSKVEMPIKSHFELDMLGSLSPRLSYGSTTISLENKTGLGGGWGYTAGVNPIIWFTRSLGIDGSIKSSGYTVVKAHKTEYFAQGGLVYRHLWVGVPTRFTFNYVQEVANGVMPNGTETNHLQGGSVTFDSRFACAKFFCLRSVINVQTGHVLNQGSPSCDGAYGNPITCRRSGAIGGGGSASLMFEFPRRRNAESEPF